MMKRLVSVALAFGVVSALGCSHEVDSPKLSIKSIEPNLVCNAQRVGKVADSASVVVSGSGFTPLPTNVLAEPPRLMLPTIDLTRTQDLHGKAQTGTPVIFSGDPKGNYAGNLSWQSEEQMTLRVSANKPTITLDPGLYDLKVTNPDKHTKASVAQGLAVVPPPKITSVDPKPPALCTAQDPRQLIITGENLLKVAGTMPKVTFTGGGASHDLTPSDAAGCEAIPGKYAGGTVELCTSLTVDLPVDQAVLPPGTYDVVVTSPEPASCQSSETTKVVIVPPPLVSEIVPPAICVDQQDQIITVNGGSFAKVNGTDLPTVTISATGGVTKTFTPDSLDGCKPPDGLDSSFGVDLCDSLKFTVPVGALDPGGYTLVVTNPGPVGCSSSETIGLTVDAPPKVDSVAPPTICSGGSVLVATGSGFLPGAKARLECVGGVKLSAQGVDVSADGKTATATFGAGATPGVKCDFVLQNADGCDDRPLPHQQVTGTEGPILYNVDPNVAYSGINTKVRLYVTALLPPFSVKMWPTGDTSKAIDLTAALVPGKTTVIQATVPKGTAAGDYDMQVNDASGCSASLDHAVTVTDNLTVSSGQVTPSFGDDDVSVPVTIVLGTAVTSTGAPRAFLNPPSATEPATQLQSVTVIDGKTLTAVVPASTPANVYDVVIVWPDGQVAVLTGAYTSVANAPPVIDDVVPQSIVAQSGQSLQVRGTGFSGSTVSLRCNGGATTLTATAPAPTCTASGCTQTATVNASTLPAGSVCVVRVTNSDGSYSDFSAIGVTNTSLNLSAPKAGQDLITGRRALVSSAVKATSAARFLYAIGGDTGQVSGALSSLEFAPIDVFGNMKPWVSNPTSLASKRTFAGSATIGRYVYVLGGNSGSGALKTAERALVLSPEEVPTIGDLDLCLAGGSQPCFAAAGAGLDAGVYSYRVSAVISSTDPENLGGETLASDPIILRLRNVAGRKVVVQIQWAAPQDKLGANLSGITGYRIYRTPADGSPGADEVRIAEVTAATTTFIDDGSKTLGTEKPLPQGSTSAWQALPDMATNREGPAGAAAVDPSDPTKWYVYALLGRNGATGHTSYEHLTVDIQPNGHQRVGAAWTTGAEASAVGRWQFGAWTTNSVISSHITDPTETWIYLGAGLLADGTTQDDRVEAGQVQAGGELGAFADDPTAGDVVQDFSSKRVGYGTAAAAGSLFVFGGLAAQVAQNATAAKFVNPTPGLANNSWNNEGLTMTTARYLMGSSIQSAFIFLVGGYTGTTVTKSTETVVW